MEHLSLPCRKTDKKHNKTVELWTPVNGLWMISVKAQGNTYAISAHLSSEDITALIAFVQANVE
jgi:hypothetical protein